MHRPFRRVMSFMLAASMAFTNAMPSSVFAEEVMSEHTTETPTEETTDSAQEPAYQASGQDQTEGSGKDVSSETTDPGSEDKEGEQNIEKTAPDEEEDMYMVLLENRKDVKYTYDEAFLDKELSDDDWNVLLYEKGQDVSFDVITDLEWNLIDIDQNVVFKDADFESGKVRFAMPEKDVITVFMEKETEGTSDNLPEESQKTEETASETSSEAENVDPLMEEMLKVSEAYHSEQENTASPDETEESVSEETDPVTSETETEEAESDDQIDTEAESEIEDFDQQTDPLSSEAEVLYVVNGHYVLLYKDECDADISFENGNMVIRAYADGDLVPVFNGWKTENLMENMMYGFTDDHYEAISPADQKVEDDQYIFTVSADQLQSDLYIVMSTKNIFYSADAIQLMVGDKSNIINHNGEGLDNKWQGGLSYIDAPHAWTGGMSGYGTAQRAIRTLIVENDKEVLSYFQAYCIQPNTGDPLSSNGSMINLESSTNKADEWYAAMTKAGYLFSEDTLWGKTITDPETGKSINVKQLIQDIGGGSGNNINNYKFSFHMILSYMYNKSGANRGGFAWNAVYVSTGAPYTIPASAQDGIKSVANAIKNFPEITVSLKPKASEATLQGDGVAKSPVITWDSFVENTLKINVGSTVQAYLEDGTPLGSGTVSIPGGSKFYLTTTDNDLADQTITYSANPALLSYGGSYIRRASDNAQDLYYAITSNNQPITFDVTWPEMARPVSVTKTSAKPVVTNGNPMYSFAGATFTLSNGTNTYTFVCDENGNSPEQNLPIGTYTLTETVTPTGYKTANPQNVEVTAGTQTQTFTVADDPVVGEIGVLLEKFHPTNTNSDRTMENAEFTVKYYADIDDQGTPKNTWVIKTIKEGSSYRAYLRNACRVSGDSLVYGENTVPLGYVTIEETKAPDGYLPSAKIEEFAIKKTSNTANVAVTNVATFTQEKYKYGQIRIRKTSVDQNRILDGDAKFINAEFEVVNNNDWTVHTNADKMTAYAEGQVVTTIKMDASGVGTSELIQVGSYIIREKTAPEGYLKSNQTITVTIPDEDNSIIDVSENASYDIEEQVIRGGFELYKLDKETKISYPQGGASLKGIEFTLKNASLSSVLVKNTKYPEGHVYAVGEVIDAPDGKGLFITDDQGRIFAPENYLPYGTYTLTETKTNKYYMLSDTPVTFQVREDGVIVGLNDDRLITSAEEAENTPLKVLDQVVRGDFAFVKKDENGRPLANIPWMITNVETGEKHFIITDENGAYNSNVADNGVNTSWANYAPHTKDTNAYDQVLSSYADSGEEIPSYVIEDLLEAYDSTVGIWFGLSSDGQTMATPSDEVGSFPYGKYTLTELSCEANSGKTLVSSAFSINRMGTTVDYGTIDNEPVDLKTEAHDYWSGTHEGSAVANAMIIDKVNYWGLDTSKTYILVAELHKADGEAGSRTDGGIISDANGNEIRAEKQLKSRTRDGYTTMNVSFDGTSMTVNGQPLDGGTTVIFEYLYELINDDNRRLIEAHEDPEDTDQTIEFPTIRTIATDASTDMHIGLARNEMVITDTIQYSNFTLNRYYVFRGTLVDKDTGEVLVEAEDEGNGYTRKYISQKNGEVTVTFTVDSALLEGHTLVCFEKAEGNEKVIAVHEDINDEEQSVHVPKIGTVAKDLDTDDNVGKVVGTFIDTVTYENLLPGYKYSMACTLVDKATGEAVTAEDAIEFTAESANGEVQVEVDLNSLFSKETLEGKSLVAFEKCSILANQTEDEKPDADTVVGVHEDIDDEDQTIHYPKIRTTASDSLTGDHVGTVGEGQKIIDTVHYYNLVSDKEYRIEGELYCKEDGALTGIKASAVLEAGHPADGSIDLVFDVDTELYENKTLVAFEKLFHNNKDGEPVEVTQHEDPDDKDQSVHYPKIRTIAVDGRTGDEVGSIYGDLINGFRIETGEDITDDTKATIVDTVMYRNLVPDVEYTITGRLWNKEAGGFITDADGNEITASTVLPAGRHDANGEAKVVFTVDTSLLRDVTIVCFEKLYHTNEGTGEDIEVAKHEDKDSEDQSVYQLDMWTNASDLHTGTHTGDATGQTQVEDIVTLRNLVIGKEYTLTGTLYDKEMGKVLTDGSGNPYQKTVTFTAGSDDENFIADNETVNPEDGSRKVNGKVKLVFDVDGKLLEGHTAVAFEDLEHNGVRIATHSDLTDDDQSVWFPQIRTTAEDATNSAKEIQTGKKAEIKDTVLYKNLIPGTSYLISGILMDKTTGNEYKDGNGDTVTASVEFTASSSNGSIDLTFPVDTKDLSDHILVVFERLTLLDSEDPEKKVDVAMHEDIDDEDQSIRVIDIRTHAFDSASGTFESDVRSDASLTDRVTYTGLKPGKEYIVRGVLADRSTGEAVKDSAGNYVTAETKFVPEQANGYIDVVFNLNSSDMAGKKVVVFEKLYPADQPETEIAKHEDKDDEEQFINFIQILTSAKDLYSGTHEMQALSSSTIIDRVDYTGLTPGKTYKLVGTMMDKETGKALVVNGTEVKAEAEFVPEQENGFAELKFSFDSSALEGKALVVFEKLYSPSETENVIARHEDINDEDQTIYVVGIRTVLIDNATGKHEGEARENATYTDTVEYIGLTPGHQYTMKGTLMDKATAQPLTINGQTVEASIDFTPAEKNGFVEIPFEFNSADLGGKIVVAYEKLYRSKEDENPVAVHENINDADQSVNIVKITTNLTDKETGEHETYTGDARTLVDRVTYTGLTPGRKYTVKGVLMDKETGKKTGVTASAKFTPENSNGYVDLEFEIAPSDFEGKKLVAFEELYTDNTLIAVHKDINDEDQTVSVVKKNEPTTPTGTPKESVQTGDNINIALLIALIGLVAVLGIFGVVLVSKKKDKK